MAFTQRNMAAGMKAPVKPGMKEGPIRMGDNGATKADYAAAKKKQDAARSNKSVTVSTTSPAGEKLATNAKSLQRQKLEYVGKKRTPDGKLYTPASFAYAVKAGVIKP